MDNWGTTMAHRSRSGREGDPSGQKLVAWIPLALQNSSMRCRKQRSKLSRLPVIMCSYAHRLLQEGVSFVLMAVRHHLHLHNDYIVMPRRQSRLRFSSLPRAAELSVWAMSCLKRLWHGLDQRQTQLPTPATPVGTAPPRRPASKESSCVVFVQTRKSLRTRESEWRSDTCAPWECVLGNGQCTKYKSCAHRCWRLTYTRPSRQTYYVI
jgi:hypothetical protein